MDFRFSEDQESIRELARKIFESEVSDESWKELEQRGEWLHAKAWEALGQAELLGIATPVEYGGAGMGLVELSILLHEQGRVAAPIPLLHSAGITPLTIAQFGSPELKERVLRKAATGESILTVAMAEENTIDPICPGVVATPKGDGFVLNGEKICVPALPLAHGVLVSAVTKSGEVGIFYVEPNSPGVSVSGQTTTSFEVQGVLTLENVHVDEKSVVGELSVQGASVTWMLERTWACIAALQWGVAQRQLEMLAAFSCTRKQFGQPIGAFQAVSQRAGDAFIDVQSMGVTAQQAVWRLENSENATEEVMVAKYWAATGGHRVAAAAQHIHGGMGVDCDYPLYRFTLLARQLELTLGGANHTLARLGKRLAAQG